MFYLQRYPWNLYLLKNMEDEVFFTRKLINSDNLSSFTYEQGMRK